MERVDSDLVCSATDLINFLECRHLSWLDHEHARGELGAEPKRPETADLVAAKGHEHEIAYLNKLKAEHGDALVEVSSDGRASELSQAVAETGRQWPTARRSSSRPPS
jgi:hypothetical protein